MKKIVLGSLSVLLLAVAGFLVVATIYFKPFIKEQIKTQLANFGYENAEIGDVSVGLYQSSIDEIDLKVGSANAIGSIAVTYWPQQLLNKQVNAVKINDATFDVEIKGNGDVIVAGYTVPKALAPKGKNDAVQNTSAPAASSPSSQGGDTASDSAPAGLPFNEIIIKNLSLTITDPTGTVMKANVDADVNPGRKSVKGKINLQPTDAAALQKIASIAAPDVARMVTGLSGKVGTDMTFDIPNYADTSKIGGKGTLTLQNLNLTKDDIRVQNLNTVMQIDNLMPLSIAKGQKVTIDQLNKGNIPVKNIAAEFGIEALKKISVKSSSLGVAGGTISTGAFDAQLDPINTSLVANVKTVDMQTISQLLNVPQLNIKGQLNADLPITVRDGRVVIDQAVINTVLQSAVGQKLQEKATEKANEFLDKKLGTSLDKLIGGGLAPTPAPVPTPAPQPLAPADGTSQEGAAAPAPATAPTTPQQPNVKDVINGINGIMGGFGQ